MSFDIVCVACLQKGGTVVEREVRPGFFENIATPNPLPVRCENCNSTFIRVTL